VGTRWLRRSFASCGPHTYIAFPAYINGQIRRLHLGDHVVIGPGSGIWLGDGADIWVGDGCTVTAAVHLSAAARITIGRSVLMARNVSIVDNQHSTSDPSRAILEQGLDRVAPIEIKDGAWLGSNSVILPGVTVGRNAVVGANAVVRQDIPDYATAVGIPARIIQKQ
jgi:acetyltransferase-like isoleucine patch superfamily enzyme